MATHKLAATFALILPLQLLISAQLNAQGSWFVEASFAVSELDTSLDSYPLEGPIVISPVGISDNTSTLHLFSKKFERDEGLILAVGYQLNKNWSLKLGWQKFGDFRSFYGSQRDSLVESLTLITDQKAVVDGVRFSANYSYPLTDSWNLEAGIGSFTYNLNSTQLPRIESIAAPLEPLGPDFFANNPYLAANGGDPPLLGPDSPVFQRNTLPPYDLSSFADYDLLEDDSSTSLSLSVGSVYSLSERLSAVLVLERINNVSDVDINVLTLGLRYRF